MTTTFLINSDGFPIIDKDPDAVLDYTIDWTDWLAEVSDTIASIVVTGKGVTVDSSSNTTVLSSAFISGGVVGRKPSVTFQITTAGSRIEQRTLYFNIVQR